MGNKHSTTRRSKPKTTPLPLISKPKNITPPMSETENISTCYISTIKNDSLTTILSHLHKKDLLALVSAWSKVHLYYNSGGKKLLKQLRKQRIVTLKSNVLHLGGYHDRYFESLKDHTKQTSETPVNVILEIVKLEDSQSDDNCSPNVWVINDDLKLPDKAACAKLHTIVINFITNRSFKPDDSFWKKFPNLKTILLNGVAMYSEILLMISKFPLLESLFIYNCSFWSSDFMSTIFENCVTLKELHIANNSKISIDLIIPPQLEILELTSIGPIQLGLKRSVKLGSVSVDCESEVIIRVTSRLVSLKKVKLVGGYLELEIQGNLEDLFTNVKELYIDAFKCYTLFGTFEDSETIPYLNGVPKHILGTYHLNFLIFPHIRKLIIVTYTNLDTIFCAFPSGNTIVTVKRIFVLKKGDYTESKHNLSQRPIIVEYSPGKESTETEYTPWNWPMIDAISNALLRLNK